jgi:hypothetical protein
VNEATIKVTGVATDRLVGTDFSDYFTDYPLTIRHREGRLTDVLYNASVYRDGRGSVLGVFAAA